MPRSREPRKAGSGARSPRRFSRARSRCGRRHRRRGQALVDADYDLASALRPRSNREVCAIFSPLHVKTVAKFDVLSANRFDRVIVGDDTMSGFRHLWPLVANGKQPEHFLQHHVYRRVYVDQSAPS